MSGLVTQNVQCPCCWETFEAVIDCSVEQQEYVEDCYVCCRPLIFRVVSDGETVTDIAVDSENE
ncbi:CPXCG motif-containing cysteine-rich protein [Marinicella sp. S1101]|nr:CPXCG motif-containing cysteine-rich protein [Marinicella marina]MCX7554294.1 CPXCG motif-containing cysteine-rich protein [Marinicella marina]MDJ1138715.1 CPXCG motif-containing cysteine-rich protein [Marinicella marina]